MILDVFDVDHGACALAISDAGATIMFDCGHNQETGFRPSSYLLASGLMLDHLIVSHPDEDHVSDLPTLRMLYPTGVLWYSRTLDGPTTRLVKLCAGSTIDRGVQAYIDIVTAAGPPTTTLGTPGNPGYTFLTFANSLADFQDCNNLSLVSFLQMGTLNILFPGDLECAGWTKLLENPFFRVALSRVNVFVASHHGRENGYCEKVFDWCRPQLVVISDCSVRHDTQTTVDYGAHASGVRFPDGSVRRVLTTRCDRRIRFVQQSGQGVFVLPNAA